MPVLTGGTKNKMLGVQVDPLMHLSVKPIVFWKGNGFLLFLKGSFLRTRSLSNAGGFWSKTQN